MDVPIPSALYAPLFAPGRHSSHSPRSTVRLARRPKVVPAHRKMSILSHSGSRGYNKNRTSRQRVPSAILNDRSPLAGLPSCGLRPHSGRPARGERSLSMALGTPLPRDSIIVLTVPMFSLPFFSRYRNVCPLFYNHMYHIITRTKALEV